MIAAEMIDRMTEALVQRGPYDAGLVSLGAGLEARAWLCDDEVAADAPAALRVRRLQTHGRSQAGHRPMSDPTRRCQHARYPIAGSKIRSRIGEWTVRESTTGPVPDEIRLRLDKQGRNTPLMHRFRGQQGDDVRDVPPSDELTCHGLLGRNHVLTQFDGRSSGQASKAGGVRQPPDLALNLRKTSGAGVL